MNRLLLLVIIFLTAGLLLSCGDKEEKNDNAVPEGWEEFSDAVLEVNNLELKVPAQEEETANKRSSVTLPSELGKTGEFYNFTVDLSRGINFHVLGLLGWLDEILSYPPTSLENNVAIWGPFIPDGLSPIELMITIEKLGENEYTFKFEVRPKNTDDEWTNWYSGENKTTGTTARRGVGFLNIDFSALADLDSTMDLRGKVEITFDTIEGRGIDIVYDEFEDLNSDDGPFDATYHYAEAADLSGEFQFLAAGDIHEEDNGGAYPLKEDWQVITRWQSDGKGRADVFVTGGDMDKTEPPMSQAILTECWGEDFLLDFQRFSGTQTDGAPLEYKEGEESACAFEQAEFE
jgi:hypothetical protein